MANAYKGEVAFEHDGQTYKLCFSTNALCELEDALGIGVAEIASIMSDPARMRLTTTRAMFWAGLTDHQSGLDIKAAGSIMTAIGMHRAIELIGQAFSLAFPEAQARGHPRKAAKSGTGQVSSPRGSS